MNKNIIAFICLIFSLIGTCFSQNLPGDFAVNALDTNGFNYQTRWFHTLKNGTPQIFFYDGSGPTSSNGGAGMRALGPNIVCTTTICDVPLTMGPAGPNGLTGIAGANGANGADGVSPTISIGTVTAGASPSVTVTGTSAAPILNFTLKNGVDGIAGSTGPAGTTDYTLLTNKPDLSIYAQQSAMTTALAGKYAQPAGATSQYLRGDGSAVAFPALFSGVYSDLTGKPTLFAGTFAALTGLPTTLAGYGITDAYSTSNPSGYVAASGARSAISLTTTGSGAATYSSSTGILNVPTPAALTTAITGTTAKAGSYRIYQSFTITTAGTAVFQLTADGTSTGSALFANEAFTESVQPIVNDATASYQFGWAFSNSNKTLTVTVNKLSTANILTGVLGQATAPVGTVVKLSIEGR